MGYHKPHRKPWQHKKLRNVIVFHYDQVAEVLSLLEPERGHLDDNPEPPPWLPPVPVMLSVLSVLLVAYGMILNVICIYY